MQLFTVTTVSHSLYTASSDCQCTPNLCRSLELKSGFDEQAGDRFWLFFRIPPTVGVREAKSAPFERETENVLQCAAALRRNCTEHDPGYLHAATRWTHAAAALLSARLTGMGRPV